MGHLLLEQDLAELDVGVAGLLVFLEEGVVLGLELFVGFVEVDELVG